MNDNDIIKVIKHCINKTCVGCKREDNNCHSSDSCRYDLLKVALDLINRQKAEIERLQEELDGETVENMRLGHKIEVLEVNNNSLCLTLSNRARVERAEAIKEFAERFGALLADFDDYDTLHIYEIKDRLDLVKEMAEGKE